MHQDTHDSEIHLTVTYRSHEHLEKKFKAIHQGERGQVGTNNDIAKWISEDPTPLFEKPSDLWHRMQEEIKKIYHLSDMHQAIFTFKVDAEIGLHKDGGRRVVVVNKKQFLHLLSKARCDDDPPFDTRFYIAGQSSQHVKFKYDISLPHSVYLPPTFKASEIETAEIRYPAPTAEQMRDFTLRTGGMRQGGMLDSEKLEGDVAFGDINFDTIGDKGRQLAKYALVHDRRRIHRCGALNEGAWNAMPPAFLVSIGLLAYSPDSLLYCRFKYEISFPHRSAPIQS